MRLETRVQVREREGPHFFYSRVFHGILQRLIKKNGLAECLNHDKTRTLGIVTPVQAHASVSLTLGLVENYKQKFHYLKSVSEMKKANCLIFLFSQGLSVMLTEFCFHIKIH